MLKVKRLHENAILPTRVHHSDAGLDLYALEHCELASGEVKLLKTGLAFEVPPGHEMQIRPRSGLTTKGMIAQLGTVDAGYRGEVLVAMVNLNPSGTSSRVVRAGDRIAQAVIARVELWEPIECWELSVSDRGTKGHGSTGV